MKTVTHFYVENGRKRYGPFETADEAVSCTRQLSIGIEAISEFRGRQVSSREITEEEYERIGREGTPQPDASILFSLTGEKK